MVSLYIVENKNHFLVIFSMYSDDMGRGAGGRYGSLRHIVWNKDHCSSDCYYKCMHLDVIGRDLYFIESL